MTIRINRADFLRQLELVTPGLSPKEVVEQSSCFVFRGGMALTYNDEVACRAKSLLDTNITGAVKAAPLIKILTKMTEEEIEIEQGNGELLIQGKRRKTGIRMEAEITLGVGAVERPTTWVDIPAEFGEAVSIVHECAARQNEVSFVLTCVHIAPGWVEACDNFQITRYELPTGLKKPVLVKCDAIKAIGKLSMHKLSETQAWIHFKNKAGVVLSCRRYVEDYPDLATGFNFEGAPATLPKGLIEACDKANVFSEENATDNNRVLIQLRPGEMRVKGTGASGWYSEVKKLKYNGPPISFMVSPKVLMELVKRHIDCEVTSTKLKVVSGRLTYCAFLFNTDKEKSE